MNLRNQKGFTGADVIIAVLVIAVFGSIIIGLYNNYTIVSKEVERKAQATQYAIGVIEEIKQNSSTYFNSENANKKEITVYNNETIADNTAYSKTAIIKDYAATNTKAQLGYVKEVQVVLNYKLGKEVQSVELNTIIAKES